MRKLPALEQKIKEGIQQVENNMPQTVQILQAVLVL
jgi:hypothetical protein